MTTEYEASVRLGFWGDALEPKALVKALKLAPSFCDTKAKGEALKGPDAKPLGGLAKTGRVIYNCDKELHEQRHDPVAQLERIASVLRPLPGGFFPSHDVAEVELQMSFYYKKKSSGEPDFFVPTDLLSLAVLHGIRFRVTVLP